MRLKFKPRWISTLVVVASPLAALAAAPEATTEFVFDLLNAPRYERQRGGDLPPRADREPTPSAGRSGRYAESSARAEHRRRALVGGAR